MNKCQIHSFACKVSLHCGASIVSYKLKECVQLSIYKLLPDFQELHLPKSDFPLGRTLAHQGISSCDQSRLHIRRFAFSSNPENRKKTNSYFSVLLLILKIKVARFFLEHFFLIFHWFAVVKNWYDLTYRCINFISKFI